MVEFRFGNGTEIFRCVTRCALLLEFPLMRVVMAGTAGSKFHVNVADSLAVIESRLMAPLAFHTSMLAGKRII
jgi:hypothetical protein